MEIRSPEADWFSKPGDSLLAAMHRRGVTAEALATHLAGGLRQLKDLISGDGRVDADVANAISMVVGGSADFWLRRQANYERDLRRATLAVPPEEAEVWLDSIPAPGPRARGRMTEQTRQSELQRRLAFFGVGTLGAWQRRYADDKAQTRFRTSDAYTSHDGAVSFWLRQGELEAALVDTAKWNPDVLQTQVDIIRRLSKVRKPALFLPKLKQIFAGAGVALVVKRAPPGCKASGASRLIRVDKAMILLSFRHRSDEQFWFTLFHEIGHLLLHEAASFVDEDGMLEDECEREANEFAASLIVPDNRQADFDRITPQRESIMRYAVSVGINPALVLGQLQHRGRIPRDKLTYLRRHWTWEEIEKAVATL